MLPLPQQPKYIKSDCSDLRLEFLSHESIESYDLEAGYTGAALDYAQRWHVHRDTVFLFDEAFYPWVFNLTKIERQIDEKATAARRKLTKTPERITPIQESFVKYISRVLASVSLETSEQIKAEALRVSRQIRVNVAPKSLTSHIPPSYYKKADSWLELDLDSINQKLARFTPIVPNYELVTDALGRPLRESLARFFQLLDTATMADAD